MLLRLNPLLYVICGLTDFAAFILMFTVSRSLAEASVEPWYLGTAGAGLSLVAGIGSLIGGWLAHRFDGRGVFLAGALGIVLSLALCWTGDPSRLSFLPKYWLLGISSGLLYPPLMGWLNQGTDVHANRRGVSRTLILFCVAWNLGVMCGQLTAGALHPRGTDLVYGTGLVVALLNLALAVVAAIQVNRCRREHLPIPATPHPHSELASSFKRLSWLANLGSSFGNSLVIHLFPDLAVSLGIASASHGELLASSRAVIIATYLLLHALTFWHYRFSVAVASQGMAAVGLVIIGTAHSPWVMLVGMTLLGQLVGYNYFSGLYYSTAGSPEKGRALAAGIHEATLATGMAVGTIAGGVVGSLVNHRLPYLLAAVAMLVLLCIQWVAWMRWVERPRRNAIASHAPQPASES
ncbi:MAG: MFS transporter [Planctomycetales bacterium]